MAKRKVSDSVAADEQKKPTLPIEPRSDFAAKTEQHRAYLLTNGTSVAELPKKASVLKRKKPSKGMPLPSNSLEQQQGDGELKPKPAKTGKSPSKPRRNVANGAKKRKADALVGDDPVYPSHQTTASGENEASQQKTSAPKRTSRGKKASPKTKLPLKPRSKGPTAEIDPHMRELIPQPQLVSKLVHAKAKAVRSFLDLQEPLILTRDSINDSLSIVPELDLLAALTILRADYGVGDPTHATLEDAGNMVVKRFSGTLLQTENVNFVMLDFDKGSHFEEMVRETVTGHGLIEVNLLEVELEMQARARGRNTQLVDWRSYEFVVSVDEQLALSSTTTGEFDEVAVDVRAGGRLEKETARVAGTVCPAPPAEV